MASLEWGGNRTVSLGILTILGGLAGLVSWWMVRGNYSSSDINVEAKMMESQADGE